MDTPIREPSPHELRRLAESRVADQAPSMPTEAAELQRLTHELQVHQIELELQNEALRQMQAETRDALQRYTDLNNRLEETVAMRTADLETARAIAESANRAKSTFLAKMSHELRTPMNAILGLTELASRRSTDPKQKDLLHKVTTASQHLLGIINDILDLSKIDAERLTLEHIGFRIHDVLDNVRNLNDYRISEKGLQLLVEIPSELASRPLLGDPMRLGQILLNLISNAIKFTERGSIAIRIQAAEETDTDLLVRFAVEDTGIGVPLEDQPRLFTAFEQMDDSITRKYGGTGLGLAISQRLSKLMDGRIGVASTPGSGSTFWFTARFQKASPGTAAPEVREDPETIIRQNFSGTRILLVEDEPINREVALGLLEESGLAVDIASNGAEAVSLAAKTDYALILMDILMPELNGIDATRLIRQLPERAHTPILAMTANAFDEDRRSCLEAGMNDHISKPVTPLALFNALLHWLPPSSPKA